MPLNAERTVSRPPGNSISYSQISHDCGLALRWHRERIKRNGLSIALVYGSAVHRGVEAFSKGQARSAQEAVRAAVGYLDREISSPYRQKMPLTWDDPPDTNKDGTISRTKYNYGKLWCREIAAYWLQRQVSNWVEQYNDLKILRSEHQIFVPLRKHPNWNSEWTFEARIDMECRGDLIIDLKSTGEPWEDAGKYIMQARLYQAAYYIHYGRVPRFVFHVLPRVWGADRVQEWEIHYDAQKTQLLIDGVVRRKVDMIEAGVFAANPSSWTCKESWCAWWTHCAFGSGPAENV